MGALLKLLPMFIFLVPGLLGWALHQHHAGGFSIPLDAQGGIDGDKVREWINRAGTDVLSAPVPAWELGPERLTGSFGRIEVPAGSSITKTVEIPVAKDALLAWTPETPNLNSLVVSLSAGGREIDRRASSSLAG